MIVACLTMALSAHAQWDETKQYYIQTKEGLCLGNQSTADKLALIRFDQPNAETNNQKWTIKKNAEGNFLIKNVGSKLGIDNVGTPFLNLFQATTNDTLTSQQWRITPIEGKEGYYAITSVNYTERNWITNYNGTVALAKPNLYKTDQWYRISETILPADEITEPDKEPIITPGTQEVEFSTAEKPKWYKLNPYYASSPSVQKANLMAYHNGSKLIIKGACNTKEDNLSFTTPDNALWRLEGSTESFVLVNKGTGLQLTLPTVNAQQERYTLTEKGSTFTLKKSADLNQAMSIDAYYIDPTDGNYAAKGRVHADGATVELILFKNNTADITGGRGSSFIFIDVEEKLVTVTSSNDKIGTFNIAKSEEAIAFANDNFTFEVPSSVFETSHSVTRAANNPVIIYAEPTAPGIFDGWYNKADNRLISKDLTLTYNDTTSIDIEARFTDMTGIDAPAAIGSIGFIFSKESIRLTHPAESITIFSTSGQKVMEAKGDAVIATSLPKGVYTILARCNKQTVCQKFVK